MTTDPPLAQVLADLIDAGRSEPSTLLLITDEELAAATPGLPGASGPDRTGPLPWADQLSGEAADRAAEFGMRSLLARGLVRPVAAGLGAGLRLEVAPRLQVVLATRLTGCGVVRIDRTGATVAEGVAKVAVAQPPRGVVEEEVSERGFHLFTSCSDEVAAWRMARWALPASVRPVDTGSSTMAADDWPAFSADAFGGPFEAAVLQVLRPSAGPDLEQSFLAYDDGLALLAAPTGDATRLRVGPVDRSGLHGVVSAALARIRADAMTDSGADSASAQVTG